MGVLGLAVSAGPALGPALGGVLLDTFSWPALFLVNLPIGALGLVAGLRVVPPGGVGRPVRSTCRGWSSSGSACRRRCVR